MKTVQVEIIEQVELEKLIKTAVVEAFKQFSQPKQNDNTKLLTKKEASELLNITLPTLSTWIKFGKIQAYKIGGRIFLKQKEILNSLESIEYLKYGLAS